MKVPYLERRIISGDLLEIERYFATCNGSKMPKSLKENETSKGQQDLNNRIAQKKLMRLINANFDGRKGDLFVTLTYRKPVSEKTAKKEISDFQRRVRKYRKNHSLSELKYITITEKQGKWHHHVILNALPLETIMELWKHGRIMASVLDKAYNFEDLSKYLTAENKPPKGDKKQENAKEPRRKYARRWSGSHNLKKPVVEIREIKRADILKRQPYAPKGYRLLENWNIGTDIQGNLYQTFKCVKLEVNSSGTKRSKRRSFYRAELHSNLI